MLFLAAVASAFDDRRRCRAARPDTGGGAAAAAPRRRGRALHRRPQLLRRLASYIPDVCRVIEAAARANAIDSAFFARLLWKESLFDAAAVSPAGAQGIAQFMPGTAELRSVADAFNPAEAMYASAAYLAELTADYGNIGLAAAAYNAGEAGLERFLAAKGGLPAETRAYVAAITGHPVETWRDTPPASVDLALAKDENFQAACIARAAGRAGRVPLEPQVRPGAWSSPRTATPTAPSARSGV